MDVWLLQAFWQDDGFGYESIYLNQPDTDIWISDFGIDCEKLQYFQIEDMLRDTTAEYTLIKVGKL